ncbi:hypothetical protein VE03_06881 [Pseudogymnoascus sp. 23342-1-I1]|nr:hypothetical protein VE03_06881 [Pseudogymnoascus sp. 23342-1-I1]
MPNTLKNILVQDFTSYPYIFEQNVDVPLTSYENGLIRVNVYRPHDSGSNQRYPVLVTYGPYGKDVPYEDFRKPSFDQVNPDHKSVHSAWETPDPLWWTQRGYIVVRADERGVGQSPGVMDTMSCSTSEAFFDLIEWSADQYWSSGKVGLLGISYYAGSQWRVAARSPRGLAAIIPWEGMSDYYRDRVRHGGILSDKFIRFWWNTQVGVNQYGRPRKPGSAFPPTIEGDLTEEELKANLNDQTIDTAKYRFRDDEYYASKDFNLEDIKVPVLSVANWGGILLHLRGNVEGYSHAGSTHKYLRFITGRHDLPFYYREEAELQKSFLDAFLKSEDRVGWSIPGKVAPVSVVLRKGNVGVNNAEAEKAYRRRDELAWPLPSTEYDKYYLGKDGSLSKTVNTEIKEQGVLQWKALSEDSQDILTFTTAPFPANTEFTGHVVAHLNVSVAKDNDGNLPADLDLFITVRHLDSSGQEIFYTGTAGDPVPVTKGWLRCSLRRTNPEHPHHRPYLPYRNYFSTDVEMLEEGEVYAVDVEIWPTNVVVEKGGRVVFEVASADTQGSAIFKHEHPEDRNRAVFAGLNRLHFGVGEGNYVTLPYIRSE